jgi:hypothetical protein
MKAKHGIKSSLLALAILLAVVAVVAQENTARAADYDPSIGVSLSDYGAGANADVNVHFTIPANNAYWSAIVNFMPAEWGVAPSADLPLGAYTSDLISASTLGVFNAACNTATAVSFQLLNSSVDTTDTVAYADQFVDDDGNTLVNAVEKYPAFLNTLFPGLTPTARWYGQTQVSGTPVSMNFVFFPAGTTLIWAPPFEASQGALRLTILQDPTAPVVPQAVSDNCTPMASDTAMFALSKDNPETAADESGHPVMTNPAVGGDYKLSMWTRAIWDADNDGYSNDVDTCAYVANEGSPYEQGSGDNDKDGIDNACDPTPDENTNSSDHDDDLYKNRQDNCPLVANADNADKDRDNIGDACDQNPDAPDGETLERLIDDTVTITGGAAAETPAAETPAAETPAAETPPPAETAKPTPTVSKPTPTVSKPTPTVAKPTPTVAKPTPTTAPTTPTAPAVVGGAGLLKSDEGFPVWAIYIIGMAAVLMLGGIGTAATVVWRRKR